MESLRIVPSDKLLDKQQVGQGAYGTVYRSRHIDWGQVALKEVVANHLAPKYVLSNNTIVLTFLCIISKLQN